MIDIQEFIEIKETLEELYSLDCQMEYGMGVKDAYYAIALNQRLSERGIDYKYYKSYRDNKNYIKKLNIRNIVDEVYATDRL